MNDVIKRFRKLFTYDDSIRDIEDGEIIDVKYINPGVTSEDIEHFIQSEIRKAKEEARNDEQRNMTNYLKGMIHCELGEFCSRHRTHDIKEFLDSLK